MDSSNEDGDWGNLGYGHNEEEEEELEDDEEEEDELEEEVMDAEEEDEEEELMEDDDDDEEEEDDDEEDDEVEEAKIVDEQTSKRVIISRTNFGGKTSKSLESEDDDELEDEEDEEDDRLAPRKRPRHLAFAFVHGQASHSDSTLSFSAQTILKSLLQNHNCSENNRDSSEQDMAIALEIISKVEQEELVVKRSVVVGESPSSRKTMSDLEIVQLTKTDNLSFLGSVLAVLEHELQTNGAQHNNNNNSVPARVIMRRSCLSISPKQVPAGLDAEEMSMAALEFLSSSFTPSSNSEAIHPQDEQQSQLPKLPLIRPLKGENDIKKRNYVKAGTWEYLGNVKFQQQIMSLERLFLTDNSSYTFLKRGVFCPPALFFSHSEEVNNSNTNNNDLDFLLRKGKHKLVATAPKKKPALAAARPGPKPKAKATNSERSLEMPGSPTSPF